MKKLVIALVVLMLSVVSFAEVVKSEVIKKSESFISYQGKIESLGNVEFNEIKNYGVVFRLYNETGKVVWSEKQELKVENGIINANLGSNTNFESEIFNNKLYLTLEINGEETEKQILTGSPYSMIAKRVSEDAIVGGNGISIRKLKDGKLEINGNIAGNKNDRGTTGEFLDATKIELNYNSDIASTSLFGEKSDGSSQYLGRFVYNSSNNDRYGTGDNLLLYSYGRDLTFRAISGGDVCIGGIGTSNTNNLRVNGKIYAKEVQVTTNVFPDYVFTDSYNLKSLNEVDNFIQINGHLPGMPSAQEVIQNGMNLKEIQLKLVEKVEELTLHMIELKKENEKLKRQINQ